MRRSRLSWQGAVITAAGFMASSVVDTLLSTVAVQLDQRSPGIAHVVSGAVALWLADRLNRSTDRIRARGTRPPSGRAARGRHKDGGATRVVPRLSHPGEPRESRRTSDPVCGF
jgi:hypothetical protein